MEEPKRNEILELSFEFALEIIKYCELLEAKRKYVIAQQLLKSGTSVGANIREAQNPHSRADFISKLVISAKEADETEYWLLLCEKLKIIQIRKIYLKPYYLLKSCYQK